MLIALGTSVWLAHDANATCVNFIQSQTIAAAYEGDENPTVHTMDTCSGDDVSYQIPIATTITFDGVEYSNIYATTNSVITFGNPDNTYWAYPNTPSISLYSMDWFAGINSAPDGLDIYYSEGGFQINLQAFPYGQWNAPASNINILVAITNTGGISVAYSYQGPEYPNLRTGVRLHNGDIVSLEAWGATQIQVGEEIPTLEAEPVPEPSPTPTGPTQEELVAQEEARVVNNLLAAAAGVSDIQIITPEPDPIITPEPESTVEPEIIPEPDVIVEPEIITPEDPEFPEPSPEPTIIISPEPELTPEPSPTPEPLPSEDEASPSPEPSPEPTPTQDQTETILPDQTSEPTPSEDNLTNNDSTEGSANLLADLSSPDSFIKMTEEQKEKAAEVLGIQAEELVAVVELAKSDEVVAAALESFAEKAAENENAPMPYTLADAIVEERMEELLSNPGAVLGSMLAVDLGEVFGNLSSLGSDMTDDQREKAQEVIVPVIIASNIVAAAMTRRK